MIIPIRTEMVARRTPRTNYALILVNCAIFVFFHVTRSQEVLAFRDEHLVLVGDWPAIHQFFTYQFLHADMWHVGGNMLFLWVFGNSVNAKLGDWAYLFFYLAGGVFAAFTFALFSPHALVGASGAIASVTAAYLVLFPRSHVTVLILFFFISFFEVPAIVLILFKVILWDNVLSPAVSGGSNIAFSAHLGGYAFGFVGALLLLLLKAVPRDHFDLLGLIDRWNRRRSFRAVMSNPSAQRHAKFGTVARPIAATPAQQAVQDQRFDRVTDLRLRIAELIEQGHMADAAARFEELVALDPAQCLPARQQLLIAREFYASGRAPQAANAFERYISCYRDGYEVDEVRLLLGIIYARDLQRFQAAEQKLTESLNRLNEGPRRDQCLQWLEVARNALGKRAADA